MVVRNVITMKIIQNKFATNAKKNFIRMKKENVHDADLIILKEELAIFVLKMVQNMIFVNAKQIISR